MSLSPVQTDGAPPAIGPYSQAIVHGGLVYCSGQIALGPTSGRALVASDVPGQTRQALTNLRAVLEAAGSGLESVTQCTVYLLDMADFAAMNEVYGELFGAHKPARATVAVSGLPLGARVEISAIGALRAGPAGGV